MINRKYKIEGNRLVKRKNGIPVPDDVPTFVLLAQDVNALAILTAYRIVCKNLIHCTDLIKTIEDFDRFRKENPDRMKEPDTDD